MKIMITGAHGLLGQKLVELLRARAEVSLLATAHRARQIFPDTPTIRLDVASPEEAQAICKDFRPDWIVNAAAMTQVDACEINKEACWQTNTNAVGYLAEACLDSGAKLLHLSTDFIFKGDKLMLAEDEAPAPINYYGASKLAAEQIVQSRLSQWAIIRTQLVYGRAEHLNRTNIALWAKENLERKNPIRAANDQWRTPTLAEDLAEACWLAMRHDAAGIFHISGEELMTPYDIAVQIAQRFHLDASLIAPVASEELNQAAARPPKTGFNIQKAKRELGYRPHSFAEGLSFI